MTPPAPALGIDLGTTNSAAAILRDGAVVVLENRLGELLTPSVVAVDRETDALLVGRPARELLSLAPHRVAAGRSSGGWGASGRTRWPAASTARSSSPRWCCAP